MRLMCLFHRSAVAAPPPSAAHLLSRLEVLALLALCFFLPLLEAPKNLCWLLFVLLWLGRAQFAGAGWGGRWRASDVPFAALLSAATLACLWAPPWPQQWGEVGDVLRYLSLGWLLSRSRWRQSEERAVLLTVLFSTLLAAGIGWWRWKVSGTKPVLELLSVGHVNHSAIYLAMVAIGTLAVLLLGWRVCRPWQRLSLAAAWLGQSWLLLTGESRGALLAFIAASILLALLAAPRRARLVLAGGMVAATVGVLLWQPYLLDKTRAQWQMQQTTSSSYRVELARTALAALRERPLSGLGPANFRQADAHQTAAWLAARGEQYLPDRYFHAGHAHSLYFNTLAERGLLGALALLLLACCWLRPLCRLPSSLPPTSALRWGIGLAGFTGVFATGLFNTSLHHEHGLLAMLAFGLLLAPPALPAALSTHPTSPVPESA